jgi:hypothetical protein
MGPNNNFISIYFNFFILKSLDPAMREGAYSSTGLFSLDTHFTWAPLHIRQDTNIEDSLRNLLMYYAYFEKPLCKEIFFGRSQF